jgi:hypothetical protein
MSGAQTDATCGNAAWALSNGIELDYSLYFGG